jgi:glycolate oxidase FAD binding subunit
MIFPSPLPLTETVAPADQAALAEAVRAAFVAGTPVYPIGGGTSLGYGVTPRQPGLGLSLAGLTRLVDYPARDLTITVEAGMTIAALSRRLAAEGQRLPIDVAQPDRATVGGCVATGAAGPRRYRWGTIRDYVLGLTAVDGCGELFHAGGRVVKNAAGYGICRLLTGSLGTLGVIVQVTLMVKPLPEISALVACGVEDLEMAERLLAGMVRTQTLPSAIEWVSGPEWQDDPALGPLGSSAAGRLLVGFEGTLSEVDWMLGQLHEEWRQAGIQSPLTVTGARAEPLWSRLAEFRAKADDSASSCVTAEIRVLPSAVVDMIRRVQRVEPRASIEAHAGNGVLLVRFALDSGRTGALASGRLQVEVEAVGGSMVLLTPLDGAPGGPQSNGSPPSASHVVMKAIKDRFDPKGILNRGRFL